MNQYPSPNSGVRDLALAQHAIHMGLTDGHYFHVLLHRQPLDWFRLRSHGTKLLSIRSSTFVLLDLYSSLYHAGVGDIRCNVEVKCAKIFEDGDLRA